jgi:hypothetical protein
MRGTFLGGISGVVRSRAQINLLPCSPLPFPDLLLC